MAHQMLKTNRLDYQTFWSDLVMGKSISYVQNIYIWIVFSELVIVSLIAQFLFPTPFNFLLHTISDQGSFAMNPTGSLIWRIGVIINGIAHIPHIFFIYQKTSRINSLWAKISTLFGLIAAIGFSLVGLISLDFGASHYVMAVLAFVGYYVTAILDFIILYDKKSPIKDFMKKSRWIKLFIVYYVISGALCLGAFILSEIFPFFTLFYPVLEWNYLLAICVWLGIWPRLFFRDKNH